MPTMQRRFDLFVLNSFGTSGWLSCPKRQSMIDNEKRNFNLLFARSWPNKINQAKTKPQSLDSWPQEMYVHVLGVKKSTFARRRRETLTPQGCKLQPLHVSAFAAITIGVSATYTPPQPAPLAQTFFTTRYMREVNMS